MSKPGSKQFNVIIRSPPGEGEGRELLAEARNFVLSRLGRRLRKASRESKEK